MFNIYIYMKIDILVFYNIIWICFISLKENDYSKCILHYY